LRRTATIRRVVQPHIRTYVFMYNAETERPIVWVGSSRTDLRRFPRQVRRDIGQSLYAAQQGEVDPSAKPLKGFGGASVIEIVARHRGDAWRVVYTVRFEEAVYVLHAFQKKSRRGIATPKNEIDLVRQRLAEAQRLHRERQN
jgi:phage-related protein